MSSPEQSHPNFMPELADEYAASEDQAGHELELLAIYERQFPRPAAGSGLFHGMLQALQPFIDTDAARDQVVRLPLQSPSRRTAEERKTLLAERSPQAMSEILNTDEGYMVIGSLSKEAQAALTSLYMLVGATLEQDNRPEENAHSRVIRRGQYYGTPVYFAEHYDRDPFLGNKETFSVRVLGEEHVAKMRSPQPE